MPHKFTKSAYRGLNLAVEVFFAEIMITANICSSIFNCEILLQLINQEYKAFVLGRERVHKVSEQRWIE